MCMYVCMSRGSCLYAPAEVLVTKIETESSDQSQSQSRDQGDL